MLAAFSPMEAATPTSTIANPSARHGRSFTNPWPSAKTSPWRVFSRPLFEKRTQITDSFTDIQTVKPTFMKRSKLQKTIYSPTSASHREVKRKLEPSAESIHSTWLGHASVLVQLRSAVDPTTANNINVLFDPVFSQRASPFSCIGPKRRLAAPCAVNDLPVIHAVCISHNHYDHLDKDTIAKLVKHDVAGNTMFFVPLGCGKVLLKACVPSRQIVEKDWWEDKTLCFGAGRSLRITCTPAQHNSSRKLFDWDRSLWCSWVVEHEQDEVAAAYSTPPEQDNLDEKKALEELQVRNVSTSSVFFGGDTGYRATSFGPVCPVFKEIGSRCGPFDLAFVPIWRGCVLGVLSKMGLRLKPEALNRVNHCTPMDAMDLHTDIQAKTSVAIHHGTFVGEDETRWAIQLLKKACDGSFSRCVQFQRGGGTRRSKENTNASRFVVLNVGESIAV